MPSFSTPIIGVRAVLDSAISRRARWSGQRLFVFGVDSVPSVIESPKVTTAPVCAGAETSTADRKNHACVVVITGSSAAPA